MKRLMPNWRILLVMLHDAAATAVALLLSLFLRFDFNGLEAREDVLRTVVPLFIIYAAGVYSFFTLYRSKWRFASLPDLVNICRAATVLAISLLAVDYIFTSSAFYNQLVFGKITLFLYWVLQMAALGAGRIFYRYYRYTRARRRGNSQQSIAALLVGSSTDADILLRGIESGAVKNIKVLGLLSPATGDQGQDIRATPVLGRPRELEYVLVDLEQNQQRPNRIILLPSAFADGYAIDVLKIARRFDIFVQRVPHLDDGELATGILRLKAIDIEDLLFRESVDIDYDKLRELIGGKKVVVTGGAGSIGSEICERVVALGAAELLVLDHAEAALFAVSQKLRAISGATEIRSHLADVRNEERLHHLLKDFAPHLVFHAAALKHVPIVEQDWVEGITTNVNGTVNLCRAAIAAKAEAVVIISTDKAVEPVSVLGLSKRFGEFYAGALDKTEQAARLISVRFGNVLGSSGSVVPIFKEQIAAGGPVTVTHQAMVRYFMTMREACDLVLTSASHAHEDEARMASVYVLDMGQPVRILDLAERLIRLSGLEPEKDIEIQYTGIRPGERLHENIFARDETLRNIGVAGVSAAHGHAPSLEMLDDVLVNLAQAVTRNDRATVLQLLNNLLTHAGTARRPQLKAVQ
ncbi:MAG: SDR family NAD(P)-dependent oxidoreductase [Pseudomonadota bacterium]